MADTYPLDSPSPYPAAEIARAWERERPGTPTDSIEIVTPLWRLAKLGMPEATPCPSGDGGGVVLV